MEGARSLTDARLPERLLTDRRYQTLPLDAFKSYHVALMWAVSNRTEGLISPGIFR
ncbi:hypothetical protein BTZ20_4474 [Rhodococcus sp. MTM3W5.2]|nr:hypothetical protein BTZ20_4474 [Rhodococcus sp. MTM3W5.2]